MDTTTTTTTIITNIITTIITTINTTILTTITTTTTTITKYRATKYQELKDISGRRVQSIFFIFYEDKSTSPNIKNTAGREGVNPFINRICLAQLKMDTTMIRI
jgi:hypothetical protein